MEVHFNSSATKKYAGFPVILLLSVLIASCGGGGGGSTPAAGNDPDPDPVVQTLLDKSISGQVSAGASGGASTAATAPDVNAQALVDVEVIAVLYSAGVEIGTLSTTTDDNGAFRLAITEQENQLVDRVLLTFQKDGYTVGQKTIVPKQNSVVITRLGPVNVATQTRDQLAFAASGTPTFRFAIVKQADGSVAAVAGSDYAGARAAAGAETLMDLSIPADRVASDVTAVTAQIAHFDPNDPNQVQSFPGDFMGSGDVTAGEGIDTSTTGSTSARIAAGEEEYRLISSVFSQVDLIDQNGDALELTESTGARSAANGDNPEMYLSLPLQSYATITADQDDAMDGIQVPIYVYKGGWQYVGNGTLVTYDGTDYVLPDPALALPLDSVANAGLFVRIQITAGNEWIRWVNLDWPIKAVNEVKKICFIGNIVYAGDENETFTGNLNINMPDGGYDWPYIQDGVIDFERLVFGADADITDPTKWSFYVWNPRAYLYEYMDLSSIATFVTSTTDCVDNDLGTMQLTNPRQYRLIGKASKNGVPVQGASIFVNDVNGNRFWEWAVTNVNGEYSMTVPGTLLNYELGSETGQVQVNGVLEFSETSDNGSVVRQDFSLPNQDPQLTNFYIPRRMTIPAGSSQASASVVAGAFDADSASLAFNWSCSPAASCTVSTAARTASAFGSSVKTFTAITAGEYTVSVTVTDPDGGAVTKQGVINVQQGNRAPRALSVRKTLGSSVSLLSCDRKTTGKMSCKDSLRTGDAGNYRINFSDADGDPVTINWDGFGCPAANNCDFTATADGKLSATLSDAPKADAKSDLVEINMVVQPNQAPEIVYAFALPANILVAAGGTNTVAVSLEASAIDDVAVASQLWSVTDDALAAGSDPVFTSNNASASIPVGTLAEGNYTATFTATDGDAVPLSTSAERQIRVYSNVPPMITSIAVSANVFAATSGTNDTAIELTSTAEDEEGDTLSYEWTVNEQTYNTQNVTLPAGSLPSGNYVASLVVRDGSGKDDDSVSFRVNAAPQISAPTQGQVVNLTEQGFLNLQAVATDDFTVAEDLQYSWSLSSAEVGIDPGLSLLMSAVGNFTVSLTVTDLDGLSSSVSVSVIVAARVNVAPQIRTPTDSSSFTRAVDKDLSIQSDVTDDTTAVEDLVYTWTVDSAVAGNASTLVIEPNSLSVGSHPANLTVTDEDSASSSVDFTIVITEANVTPPGNLEVIID